MPRPQFCGRAGCEHARSSHAGKCRLCDCAEYLIPPRKTPFPPLRAVETPGELIASFLDGLTVSQGLEALADSFHRRAATLPRAASVEIGIFEGMLRGLAEEARWSGV